MTAGVEPVARRAAKAVVPRSVRWTLRVERDALAEHGLGYFARWNTALATSWTLDRLRRRHYRLLDEAGVRAARRSDTIFVFGSGASLNDITPAEWESIAEHDVLGFNWFYLQRWIRVDFHVIRGGAYGELHLHTRAGELRDNIVANPNYAETIFLLNEDYLGHFANFVVGHDYLPEGARLFRYRTAPGPGLPTRSFADGLRHAPGTLSDAVNFAYCGGWKHIVLAGVDLYDSRYFWLPPDQTITYDAAAGTIVAGSVNAARGNEAGDKHNTVRGGVVEQMGEWSAALAADGVRLSVYNPRSLLAEVLPVYDAAAE